MATTKPEPVTEERLVPRRLFDWLHWPEWASLLEAPLFEETMRIEQYEEGTELVVKAEMPGLDPDKDVDIQVVGETLRIRAERRQETKTEEKGRYRSEFRYGSFSRTLPLPTGATEADVKATYKDGILEVRVPIDR
ncbi:MAG TPA: Hsp20/alpha crystallin family protein, partial [Acidimicrobiia bacterium]